MSYNGPLPQVVNAGGTGAATLTGSLLGNGTSAVTALTGNSKVIATNSSGTFAARAFSINVQTFTSAGTYTPTSGMLYCTIVCVGNGGGGGGTASAAASTFASGAGGGGGSTSSKFASAATIGASQSVTFGTTGSGGSSGNHAGTSGGDVAVGSICIGKGGTGGTGNSGSSSPAGGAGGVAGTGDWSVPGCQGDIGYGTTSTLLVGTYVGAGGNSLYGFGAPPTTANTPATGNAGQNYGAGGGGGTSFNADGAAAGGAGSTGIVVITEYIIA